MTRTLLVILLVACGSKATTPSNTAVDPPASPSSSQSPLGPDGTHVAAERVYEGRCAPAGSRGGCVTITLRPNGTYRNWQYDAAIDGTYTIAGHTLTLAGGPEA